MHCNPGRNFRVPLSIQHYNKGLHDHVVVFCLRVVVFAIKGSHVSKLLSSGEVDVSSPELDDDLILLFLKKLDKPSAVCY